MSEEHVVISREGAVLEIRLNRPEKKNAFTAAMYGTIADALEQGGADPDIRCFLFTAAGDYFSAGNDVKDFAAQSAGQFTGPRNTERFMSAGICADKPIVAGVRGHCVGVGVTMLMHCDLVYIAEDARLTTQFIDLGVVPEFASSLTMIARVGYARTFALLGLNEPLNGRDAAAYGLVNAALPSGEVETRARAAAQALAKKPTEAMQLTKRLLRDRDAMMIRMRVESDIFAERLKSPEAAAAFAAFLQKR